MKGATTPGSWWEPVTSFLATSLIFGVATASAQDAPSRIVSINLCADELLLSLANPAQITALSPYSVDPQLSFLADAASAYRHDAAEAETVVDLDPDLVLAGRYTKRATRDMLERLGYRVVTLDPARSIEESIDQIREIAEIVGHVGRGEELVDDIKQAEGRAAFAAGQPESAPTAAVYQRRGYVTGAETLTNELLATVGVVNLGGDLAGPRGGFVPLETIVAESPDFLVMASPVVTVEDQGTALLAHPALVDAYPADRRILLPENLTVCGGPSVPAALDWLSAEIQRLTAVPTQ